MATDDTCCTIHPYFKAHDGTSGAELWTSAHNPDPTRTTALAYRVAQDLKAWGHHRKAISTDNGNEYRAQLFCEQYFGCLFAQFMNIHC